MTSPSVNRQEPFRPEVARPVPVGWVRVDEGDVGEEDRILGEGELAHPGG